MAGESKDQKDAAIITPPAKPSMPSIQFLFTFLKNTTLTAPRAVNDQVNRVANNARVVYEKFCTAFTPLNSAGLRPALFQCMTHHENCAEKPPPMWEAALFLISNYSLGSTGSLSSASTPNTQACT